AVPEKPPVNIDRAVPLTSGSQVIETMQASWDDRWIYYDSNLSGNADVHRIPLAGGEPERITTDPADEFLPTPSPDGTEVSFHSYRTGTRDVFVKSLAGGEATQVTASPMQECCTMWSPDGRALVFSDYRAMVGPFIVHRDAAGKWGTPMP